MGTTPIIYVYGISDSGKTRLVERLVLELIQKGHRVGTLKLSRAEALDIDPEGKDTQRHMRAGSMATGGTSQSNAALFFPKPQSPEKLIEMMLVTGELDLVIIEGLGDDVPDVAPKIAVGDVKGRAPGTVIELPDPEGELGAVLHIMDRVMSKKVVAEATVKLRVGGNDVTIKPFVQDYLEGTLRGAIGALKEAGKPGDEIELRIPKRVEGAGQPPRSLDID